MILRPSAVLRPIPPRALVLLLGLLPLTAQATSLRPGSAAAGGAALEPTGQYVTPEAAAGAVFQQLDPELAGAPDVLAGGAISTALSPDRQTLMVLTSGYNMVQAKDGSLDRALSSEYVFVYGIAHHRPVKRQVLRLPTTYAGIVFTPDGRTVLVGTGGGDSVQRFRLDKGAWMQDGAPMKLGHASGIGGRQGPSTAGLAVTADGTRLAVANIYNDSVSLLDLATGRVTGELDLRPGIEDPAQAGRAGGETPFWIAISGNDTAYVSSQRDREIDVLDIAGPKPALRARIAVRGTPNKILLDRSGRHLYVAADNDDSVQVIDTASRRVTARIEVAAPEGVLRNGGPRYRGAAPNALALSEDERTLYVSNGGENAVAVVSLDAGGGGNDGGSVRALLPTGWYPNAVSVADGWLFAANGKSEPGPNAGLCASRLRKPTTPARCRPNQYILQLEAGGLLAEPLPRPEEAATLTRRVAENDGFDRPVGARDRAMMAALHKRIRHVIYIVKENRTYDQVLGDLGRGNGDPSLAEFGRRVTPNFHRMAEQFVDLDNFLDSGSVSGNGWPWSTSARETDVNVKIVPLQYSGRHTNAPYDAEGQNRDVDVGIATAADRRKADPNYPDDPNLLPGTNNDDAPDAPDDDDDDAGSSKQHGYLWDAALKAGLSVRNYGFLSDLDRYGANPKSFGKPVAQIPEDRTPFADHVQVDFPTNPTLIPRTDIYFRGFDNAFPDYWRAREWAREFDAYEKTRTLPSLSLLRLMHDHMGSFSTAIDGVNTPELQQADDDYAVGLVLDRVAHSPDADDTLIFVIEDDAQDGPDHVDAHRSTAYVVGPYVKQGAVVSTRYSTVNMLRTIEDVLGIGHLNLNDAYQPPMTDIFDLSRRHWSYAAAPSDFLYDTSLPLPRRRAEADPVPTPTHPAAWWTAQTPGYDWTHEDRVPAVRFNEVVWRGLWPDRPYPTTRSGTILGR